MTAKILLAGIFLILGSTASFAQYGGDVTSEGQATINEEQKLGPDAVTHQFGNTRFTTAIPWWYGRRAYQRNVY